MVKVASNRLIEGGFFFFVAWRFPSIEAKHIDVVERKQQLSYFGSLPTSRNVA